MSGNLSWYQKQLGVSTPQAPVAPRAVPQFLPGPDGRVYRVSPVEDQPLQFQPQYGQGPSMEAPIGQIHLTDAVRMWKGSRGAQVDSSRCPECNSANYFDKIPGNSKAAGRCYDCGYSSREDLRPSRPMAALTSGPSSGVRNDGQARSPQYTSPMAQGQGFGAAIGKVGF